MKQKTPEQKDKDLVSSAKMTGIQHGLGLTALFTAAAGFSNILDLPEIAGTALVTGVFVLAMAMGFNDKLNRTAKYKSEASSDQVRKQITDKYKLASAGAMLTSFIALAVISNIVSDKEENEASAKTAPDAKELVIDNTSVLDARTYQYQPA